MMKKTKLFLGHQKICQDDSVDSLKQTTAILSGSTGHPTVPPSVVELPVSLFVLLKLNSRERVTLFCFSVLLPLTGSKMDSHFISGFRPDPE